MGKVGHGTPQIVFGCKRGGRGNMSNSTISVRSSGQKACKSDRLEKGLEENLNNTSLGRPTETNDCVGCLP